MKYKILSNDTLVTCDGQRHVYKAIDEDTLIHQPHSALCWCHGAGLEQLERWSTTEEKAKERKQAMV